MRRRSAPIVLLAALTACGPTPSEINRVIDRGALVVGAIQAYTREVGRPPRVLDELVPSHLAAIPVTGLGAPADAFHYVVDDAPPFRWKLSVRLEGFGFKHMRFDASGRYEIPVKQLRDGWVMVNP